MRPLVDDEASAQVQDLAYCRQDRPWRLEAGERPARDFRFPDTAMTPGVEALIGAQRAGDASIRPRHQFGLVDAFLIDSPRVR